MSAGILVVAPVLVPLGTGVLAALAAQRPALQRGISYAGIVLLGACALALVALTGADRVAQVAFGDWPAPFGIEFRIDRTSAALLLVTAVLGAASLLFLASDADTGPARPLQLPLVHGLLAGVAGSFCTADLFNLYVWFEVMLIAALGLFAGGDRLDQLDATFKYLALNLFGTLLLLLAIGFIYAQTGQLNFATLADAAPRLDAAPGAAVLAALTLAFLIKAGAFPLFAWLPASYHTLPAPLLALVAGLLTKVGVYAVLRTLGGVFAPAPEVLLEALGWIAAATLLTGVLGAAYHWDLRRILAFHGISQVGYMLLGIALASDSGKAATLFYVLPYLLVQANLFLIAAIVFRVTGSYDLRQIGGVYASRPLLAVLFLVPALSLVGVPPLSGFWAKFFLVRETLAAGRIAWTTAALVGSALTLYSMIKIFMEAFWKPHPDPAFRATPARLWPAWTATLGLAALTLAIGLNPQPLIAWARAAALTMGTTP